VADAAPERRSRLEGKAAALEELAKFLPAPPDIEIAARAEHISVCFGMSADGRSGGVRALDDVSIDVPSKSFTSIIGPNGAGKTTLFDVLNGFTSPATGTVFLFERDVTRLEPWNRAQLGMGRTFQMNHIDPHLTVLDNLRTGAYRLIRGGLLAGIVRTRRNLADERRVMTVARAVARTLDLEPMLELRAGNLDFGGQRRVEIGRSLMSGPQLLLLDEPTAGVDVHEASELMALVKDLQVTLGLTILLIEHYLRAVMENSDLVYVLAGGRRIAAGTVAEVVHDPAVKSAYLGG
jgi:ABC-type branched-subunit amino acid transport system ATPase component